MLNCCRLHLVSKIPLLSVALQKKDIIIECSCVFWHLASGKGDTGSDTSATVALESPFALYGGRFELGLSHSMV
jgi:hypothetical protein